jgi:hypothetical protein
MEELWRLASGELCRAKGHLDDAVVAFEAVTFACSEKNHLKVEALVCAHRLSL